MTSPRAWRWLLAVLVIALPAVALARPGGGDSYSGGGGHGGSSGGGGSGGGGDSGAIFELIIQLIRLCIYYPKVGVPIVVILLVLFIRAAYVKHKNKDWDSGPPVKLEKSAPSMDALTRVDPDFSRILFEDFAFRLYATAHHARGVPGKLDELAPYLAPPARAALAARKPAGVPVTGVVIGAMRTFRVDVPSPDAIQRGDETRCRIGLDIEANYAVGAPGREEKRFAVESWLLSRSVTARTRPPTAARTFPCPNCGAPWQNAEASRTQRCAYCGEVVDNGRFDWQVEQINLRHEKGGLPSLRTDVPERGTDLPTYRQDDFDARWRALTTADPSLTAAAIEARLRHVYGVVNRAWTEGDLRPARTVLSDGLADYFQYWLDAYRAQGLQNVLADMRITKIEPAKLTRDRWYDAITIRLWGTGKDYVVQTTDGAHVRGSKRRERAYSEYWTLIRSSARRAPPRIDGACGNCGAPLVVTMAGACGHCGVHVTAGEFDWVLSRIEQDDSYRG